MYKETTQDWGQNHPRELEGTIFRTHKGLGIVPFLDSQSEELIIHGSFGRVPRRVLLQY